MTSHGLLRAVPAVVALALVAACGSTTTGGADLKLEGSTDPSLTALYDAAVKAGETKVVFYGPQATDLKPAFDLFEKRFPKIDVQAVSLFGPQLDTKLHTEASTNKHSADLVQVANAPISFARDGLCQSYRPPTASDVDARYADLDDQVIASTAIPFGILYNKNVVKNPPTSWDDVISGDYKGQIVMADPSVGGVADAGSAGLVSGTFTEDFLRKLNAQDIQTVSDGQTAAQAVATGQKGLALFLPDAVYQQLSAKGVNVGFAFPLKSGNYVSPFLNCLVTDAPHPDAAKLLESWFFTTEAAGALAAIGQYSTVTGVEGPKGLPSLADVAQMHLPSLAETFDESIKKQPTVAALLK
jgi:ABC-type Fe3+ transport system substrate-binding protein